MLSITTGVSKGVLGYSGMFQQSRGIRGPVYDLTSIRRKWNHIRLPACEVACLHMSKATPARNLNTVMRYGSAYIIRNERMNMNTCQDNEKGI